MRSLRSLRSLRALPLAALVLGALACDESTAPGTRTDDQLTFLQFAAGAPPLAQTTVSFWAVKGQDRRGRLHFVPEPGASDTAEFMTLRVRAGSLLRRPDGSLVAEGDSVLITATVVDPARLLVHFEPAGLVFSRTEPAELKFEYDHADDDLNGDGSVNDEDAAAERAIRIWRQERPGAPWVAISSVLEVSLDDVEADLFGFTNYALAF